MKACETPQSTIEPIPEGMHIARCYAVIDLGTQHNERFSKDQRKLVIIWELAEHRIDVERDGNTVNLPRAISAQYTLSLSEKSNLRRDLVAWRGKSFTKEELAGFEMKNVLGHPCMIQVIHGTNGEKTYANVATITPLPKAVKKPEPENADVYFSFDEHDKVPEEIPEWVKEKIRNSKEFKAPGFEEHTHTERVDRSEFVDEEDDLPF